LLAHTEGDEVAHPGELRVNAGSDPGQDDYGLPPVDIEIPDDARELDHDVEIYRRELRAQRRRVMASRLAGPLTHDGLALPVIAGCLALTLLAGTLLAVFTADRGPFGPIPHASTVQAHVSPSPGQVGGLLPDATVVVQGKHLEVRTLAGPVLVLALIPARCGCARHVRQLAGEAVTAGAQIYLIGMAGTGVLGLARQAHLGPAHVLADPDNALAKSFRPVGHKLTAIVVRAGGTVAQIVADKAIGFQLTRELASLTSSAVAESGAG
jgi:hypothetical protein